MNKVIEIFEKYLHAQVEDVWDEAAEYMDDATLLCDSRGNHQGLAQIQCPFISDSRFNVKTAIYTNPILTENKSIKNIYAQVHYLFAEETGNELYLLLKAARKYPIGTEVKENNELHALTFGGKYHMVWDENLGKIRSITFDQEYAGGNTYLLKGLWSAANPPRRRIDSSTIQGAGTNAKEAVYKMFWAMDVRNEKLFQECCTENVMMSMALPEGGSLELNGFSKTAEFLKNDKAAYDQNYHSVYLIGSEESGEYTAYRLRPDNTGNKFRGARDKYVLFFNEIYNITVKQTEEGWKVSSVRSRRVETPSVFGYSVLGL